MKCQRSIVCRFSLVIGLLGLAACGGNGSAPPAPTLSGLTPQATKIFHFTWTDVDGETEYRLLEDPDSNSGYTQVAAIAADATSHDLTVSLPRRINARYILQACNNAGCSDSAPLSVSGALTAAAGYFKASNTGAGDRFGTSVALSGDGSTLAVGAYYEGSSSTGVNSLPNDAAPIAGAVYVFALSGGSWAQQAYIKASNTGMGDAFGYSVALSDDGNTLAVGAYGEDSSTTGVNSTPNESASSAGAAYVFSRSGTTWSEQAYIKASNTGADDKFGFSVALSGDGGTLAVGAVFEDSGTTGINSTPDEAANSAGAVYVFALKGGSWAQQVYVKASNTGAGDAFGYSVALSDDGNTLAVGAYGEDSSTTGVNSTPNESAGNAGAAYVFSRHLTIWGSPVWAEQAYIKASNTGPGDNLGWSVALSGDGNTLAVGALGEDGSGTGVNSSPDNLASNAGAVYLFSLSGSWAVQAYIKASNTEGADAFGSSLALSDDGSTLAVGALGEDSSGTGVNSTPNESASNAGAVYLFSLSGSWAEQAYIKASNTVVSDALGSSLALSDDGNTLAAGASEEDGSATGVNGTPDDASSNSGAVYLY